MRRFISLAFIFFPVFAHAIPNYCSGSLDDGYIAVYVGVFTDPSSSVRRSAARSAVLSAGGCSGTNTTSGTYADGTFWAAIAERDGNCYLSPPCDPKPTGYIAFAVASCPDGSVQDSVSGECGCTGGKVLNAQTMSCEYPDTDDDFPEPPQPDNPDNTGGEGNDYGGDAPPGSECNFHPAGCLPWDTADSPPPVEDIPAPNNNDPPPPEAETTADSSSTDHTTGTTTSTTTQEWRESDGCTVKQTTTTTTNADNSSSKDMATTRTCPDGSSATTKTGWQTDSQGNTTLTGETVTKEQSKEGTVSGGGTCDSAPACKGDAIQCAMVMQQWLTRCDKNAEYGDSDCTSQPQCSGDVLLCAGLINSWQDRCALQRAGYDLEQDFQSRGFQTAEQVAQSGGVFGDGESVDISTVADGVFSARAGVSVSCPPALQLSMPLIGNLEISMNPFCTAAEYIYWLVMLSAYILAAFIIFRSLVSDI